MKKAGLKLNILKAKIIASGSITSRQIGGETMETVTDFILGASQIILQMVTAEKCLFLGRKAMTSLGSILLSRFSRVRLCVTP